MNVYISATRSSESMDILFIVAGVIVVCLVIWVLVDFWKDKSQPMQMIRVKIVEKPINQQLGIANWYVVECENGRRLKLRTVYNNQILIKEGDIGVISYKGKTIQSFQREGK